VKGQPASRPLAEAGNHGAFALVEPGQGAENAAVADDFFPTHRANLLAIEAALGALAAMRAEFESRGTGAEHWFYDLTCTAVFRNYLLHRLIAALEGDKTEWQLRVESRLLAQHTLETIDALGAMLNRTLDKRVGDITNNPRIIAPIDEAAKEFATFRRINDKAIRALGKAIGIEQGRASERVAFDKDLDATAVVKLAISVVSWLSSFGKAATLLISAIRSEKAGGAAAAGEASPEG
jgi:hypothetical protein